MKGETKSGFKFDVDEKIFDNYEFTVAYAKIMGTDPTEQVKSSVKLVELMFPKDKGASLVDFVRDKKTGIATNDAVFNTIKEILESMGTVGKN